MHCLSHLATHAENLVPASANGSAFTRYWSRYYELLHRFYVAQDEKITRIFSSVSACLGWISVDHLPRAVWFYVSAFKKYVNSSVHALIWWPYIITYFWKLHIYIIKMNLCKIYVYSQIMFSAFSGRWCSNMINEYISMKHKLVLKIHSQSSYC